jgi:hypothetical protein
MLSFSSTRMVLSSFWVVVAADAELAVAAVPILRPVFQYDPNCYHKNAEHWQLCAHPGQGSPVPN